MIHSYYYNNSICVFEMDFYKQIKHGIASFFYQNSNQEKHVFIFFLKKDLQAKESLSNFIHFKNSQNQNTKFKILQLIHPIKNEENLDYDVQLYFENIKKEMNQFYPDLVILLYSANYYQEFKSHFLINILADQSNQRYLYWNINERNFSFQDVQYFIKYSN